MGEAKSKAAEFSSTVECISQWQGRASACELLAMSLRYPDEGLYEVVSSGEWAEAAREIWSVLGKELPADWAEGVQNVGFHDVRADATNLFIGTPKAVCSPYESYWRAEDEGVQPLMFINPHAMEVERFCKDCGLAQSSEVDANDPLDHIATEFELLEYLASIEAGIAEIPASSRQPQDYPGGSANAAYDLFVKEHLSSFAPRFADKLEAEARTAYYRAAAELLRAYLA